jgi:hypothetical protein
MGLNTWLDSPATSPATKASASSPTSRFLAALHRVDPHMWVNIEQEDVAFGPLEGVQAAAETLSGPPMLRPPQCDVIAGIPLRLWQYVC